MLVKVAAHQRRGQYSWDIVVAKLLQHALPAERNPDAQLQCVLMDQVGQWSGQFFVAVVPVLADAKSRAKSSSRNYLTRH